MLNVPQMLKPILDNYDAHVETFIQFLRDRVNCQLIYDGPFDIHQHICEKTVYACSVRHVPTQKVLKDVFPIMLGSRLDLAIRHWQATDFHAGFDTCTDGPFQEADIGRGYFIILGFLRHLPYFFTNDPTHTHIVQRSCVRVFTYDAMDRGKQLCYYIQEHGNKKRGDLLMSSNNGNESTEGIDTFFDFCPFTTDSATYMAHMHRNALFDIDSLANKMVISPGHLFTKLFVKYLYGPLRDGDWKRIKAKYAWVIKSIETGALLHVLSRKTDYFKENGSIGKMTNTTRESHREIGADGQVFVEKSMGCYREVNMQTYPLNPYLLYLTVRQMSSKVKSNAVPPFHASYLGFLCILGCFETKNVGRTTMMVRGTVVSTCNELDPVFHDAKRADMWRYLNLEPLPKSKYFVVVNGACIPVTETSYRRLDLIHLKQTFRFVECFEASPFISIRYKVGILFKEIPGTDLWVTPKDLWYWCERMLNITNIDALARRFGYDFFTSFHVDLNPFFMHNYVPKSILGFNALKNAVLATDNRYHLYFMDSLSAHVHHVTSYHRTVLEPMDDGISPYFVLKLPHVRVAYMSFLGCTQEDSIVCRRGVDAFDCCRFHTLRIRIEAGCMVRFVPMDGYESPVLGTVYHYGDEPLKVEPTSIQVRCEQLTPQAVRLVFSKPPFRIVRHQLSGQMLTICCETDHFISTGDKLCSFHGQKGVLRIMDEVPILDDGIRPDLVVNPFCFFRMTGGQFIEGLMLGEGRDATRVRNSRGEDVLNGSVFYSKMFYFLLTYLAVEHIYFPRECTVDLVTDQAMKGRSRCGGMRLGNMELYNGLEGNGLGSCFQEIFFEHSDFAKTNRIVPKSMELVQQDACFYKCKIWYDSKPPVTLKVSRDVLDRVFHSGVLWER